MTFSWADLFHLFFTLSAIKIINNILQDSISDHRQGYCPLDHHHGLSNRDLRFFCLNWFGQLEASIQEFLLQPFTEKAHKALIPRGILMPATCSRRLIYHLAFSSKVILFLKKIELDRALQISYKPQFIANFQISCSQLFMPQNEWPEL